MPKGVIHEIKGFCFSNSSYSAQQDNVVRWSSAATSCLLGKNLKLQNICRIWQIWYHESKYRSLFYEMHFAQEISEIIMAYIESGKRKRKEYEE